MYLIINAIQHENCRGHKENKIKGIQNEKLSWPGEHKFEFGNIFISVSQQFSYSV